MWESLTGGGGWVWCQLWKVIMYEFIRHTLPLLMWRLVGFILFFISQGAKHNPSAPNNWLGLQWAINTTLRWRHLLGLNVDRTRMYFKFQKIAVQKPEHSHSVAEWLGQERGEKMEVERWAEHYLSAMRERWWKGPAGNDNYCLVLGSQPLQPTSKVRQLKKNNYNR